MKKPMAFLLSLALVMGVGAIRLQAAAGCVVEKDSARCDWSAFRKELASVHVVRAEYSDRDRMTGSQLKELAKDLGKTVAAKEEKAELTLKVMPASESGIDVGPADEEILQLLVYSGNDSIGPLVWVETYRGQKDRPWPANVHAVIQQFRERIVNQ